MKFFKKSDGPEPGNALDDLQKKIEEANMPPAVDQICRQELDTLTKISPSSTEYTISLTYIEYLTTLPWNKRPRTTSTSDARKRSSRKTTSASGR